MTHSQIWRAIDALAAQRGLSASGLARAAGLDPTTFNKSKRQARNGKPRWPSTESLACALAAAETNWEQFAALLDDRPGVGRTIPMVLMASASAERLFDAQGFPVGADQRVRFPDLGDAPIYALEVADDSMAPVYRGGDILIVQPGADLRSGDRVVVRSRQGEMSVTGLGSRTAQAIELLSLAPGGGSRHLAVTDVDWIARVLWASQ